LSITDEHLKISIQTLQEELYSGRPKIIIGGSEISDTNMIIEENIFSPKILTYFTNIGKRPAKNFNLRAIVVYTDLSGLRTGEDYLINTVDPGPKSVFEFKPRIPLMYKDDYYYCVEIKYYDELLKREFQQSYYYHYYKSRQDYDFFYCDKEESREIRSTMNRILKSYNKKLFDNWP